MKFVDGGGGGGGGEFFQWSLHDKITGGDG